jgi:peptidoglycan/LPS O-acetylase OafA/YrhL
VSELRRDDRVLPATHWASLAVFVILVPAVIILWGAPGETAKLWAWTIAPDLTPIFLGAGYGAGAYFFWRTFRAAKWHPSSAGVLGASVFAALMLVATLIHWDKFNHGDAAPLAAAAFYGWVGVYIVSPFVVFWLWLRNQRTDPRRPEPGAPIVPAAVRRGARVFAAGAFAAAAVFFISPDTAIDTWPWDLTPLTARVLASFIAEVGVGALMLSFDQRWSGWRLLIQTFFVATALLLVGAIRAWGDFDHHNVITWLYLGGLVGSDLGLVVLYRRMESRPSPA